MHRVSKVRRVRVRLGADGESAEGVEGESAEGE